MAGGRKASLSLNSGQLEVDTQNQLYLGVIQNKMAEHPRPLSLTVFCRRSGWVLGDGDMSVCTGFAGHQEPSPHWPMAFLMSTWGLQSVKDLAYITSLRGRPGKDQYAHFPERKIKAQRRDLPKVTPLVISSSSHSQVSVFLHKDKNQSPFRVSLVADQAGSAAPQLCFRQANIPKWLEMDDFFNSKLNLSHSDRSYASDSQVSPSCQDTCLTLHVISSQHLPVCASLFFSHSLLLLVLYYLPLLFFLLPNLFLIRLQHEASHFNGLALG